MINKKLLCIFFAALILAAFLLPNPSYAMKVRNDMTAVENIADMFSEFYATLTNPEQIVNSEISTQDIEDIPEQADKSEVYNDLGYTDVTKELIASPNAPKSNTVADGEVHEINEIHVQNSESVIPTDVKPFEPDGHATVVDLVYESDSKTFYTFKTPAGNVFYLVIDHERESDNVYFLNDVTESDLLALTENSNLSQHADLGISAIPAPTPDPPETSTATETKGLSVKEENESSAKSESNNGMYFFLIIGAVIFCGVAIYLKIIRPKQKHNLDDDDDEEDYVNNKGDDDEEIMFEVEPEDNDNNDLLLNDYTEGIR